ncbi:M9 family metallopeptidase [Myxococcus sp. MISCRS1]|uniref:M9 family metallopeptidase n=1 Tax=unclassified Myxococcus TaxID=2648731 RepID=UPI001CBE4FAA|nr:MULTISPECIES: M9 family metallopeptidase [unclassified Myxococcus]MBZ4395837.1 M9 family metallopeptidase [Myxococcus sp. AS-1-15]MCY0998799.1 M9 family metallopeptidase [Myxococcus sp. MISCRS1]
MRSPITDWCRCHIVLALCIGVFAPGADARPGAPPPTGSAQRLHGLEHAHQRILPEERSPDVAPEQLRQELAPPPPARALLAACDTAAFGSASGAALVTLVKGSTEACVNTLFGVTGTLARQVFIESKMVTIANALTTSAQGYVGDNSGQTLQLILFLRAGYYVQFYSPDVVGAYGTALGNAIRPALAAFVANSHFRDVNDAHGAVLREFVTLIDSAGESARHLATFKGLLDRFNTTAETFWYMRAATNNVFVGLFRGHYDAAFIAAVQQDSAIIDALESFGLRTEHLLGTDNQYLTVNAARELARFLQYPGALQDKSRPKVRALIANHQMTGPTAGVWVGAAEMADYYDGANCAYYGICDFRRTLEQAVLRVTYNCGATLRMRAQDMTSSQFSQSCAKLAAQETYFHDMLKTGRVPVAGDNNTALEMVIFDSSLDYQTYAGALFGIDTNNGGMYLEGDPSASGNQARFIAYEAEWVRPTFQIWNLEHEYVHYLDGRFDMKGDFGASVSQPTIWWIEGLAEYISKKSDNASAVAVGAGKAFQLSQILRNDYNSGTERVYTWGYLAVRFMFERHADQVGTFLGQFRAGSYAAYRQSLDALGTANDPEFHEWLTCVATASDPSTCVNPGPGPGTGTPCTGSDSRMLGNGCYRGPLSATSGLQYFYLWVPNGARNLRFQMSGGTGNADLYVRASTWPSLTTYDHRPYLSGNDETVDIPSPPTGSYIYLMLNARTPYSGVKLEARFDTGP